MIGANDRLLSALESVCRRIIGPTPKKRDLVHDVRELIVERLPRGSAKIKPIADEVNMSMKTLERRLAERGQSFSALLDEVRCETAKRHLKGTDMGLSQVAYLAGYTEPAALVRAFRRWTGMTPMQFRERNR